MCWTVEDIEEWYYVCGGRPSIRRTKSGSVVDCKL